MCAWQDPFLNQVAPNVADNGTRLGDYLCQRLSAGLDRMQELSVVMGVEAAMKIALLESIIDGGFFAMENGKNRSVIITNVPPFTSDRVIYDFDADNNEKGHLALTTQAGVTPDIRCSLSGLYYSKATLQAELINARTEAHKKLIISRDQIGFKNAKSSLSSS